MPYEVEYPWRNNPRLVKLFFLDTLTAEETTNALEDVASTLDKALMPLHLVLDFDQLAKGPEDILTLFSQSRLLTHNMQGYCVFLNPDQFINFMAKVLNNTLGVQIHVSLDDDEAWEFFNHLGLC